MNKPFSNQTTGTKIRNSHFMLSSNKIFTTLLLLLLGFAASAQQKKFTVSGTVRDGKTGETLIGATVTVASEKNVGTTTNEYGFYSLTLTEGEYELAISYSGYQTTRQKVVLTQNLKNDVAVSTSATELKEVVVTSEAKNKNVTQAQTGVEKLDIAAIKDIPVLFGEKDVLKTLQLLPGVKSAGEGNAGFYVRGGSADQNLILLDEAPVYNASHLLGFFSTFNSDAIKNVTLYKGNPPAQFGGRLSSVLDIKMNEGDNQNYGVSGGIGLISSKLTVEGPIVKNKGSFLVTGRRTYADMFLKLSSDTTLNNNKLYFYDFNAKANYKFGKNDQVFLSGYFGKDVLGVGGVFGIDWGNTTATLRWNHVFNNRIFSNTSLLYSKYNYTIKVSPGKPEGFDILSQIQDWNLKQEFQYYANPKNSIRFGFNTIHHTILPGEIAGANASASVNNMKLQKRYAWENAVYANNEWKASSKLNISYGVRLSAFSVMGGSDYYNFNDRGESVDTIRYDKGDVVKTYWNLEPRISAAYVLNESNSIKASYARNTQNLHLLSNSTTSSPTDRWIGTSNVIKPEISDQVAVGYYRNFSDNKYEFSAETYYKTMQNQIDYKDGATLYGNDDVEGQLLFGDGRAYGIELYVKKKEGRFTGWIGYTLSRSERKINGINNNDWYVAKQDRTHDISIVGIYQLSKRWTVSGTFVYYTGNAVSFPSGKYMIDNKVVFYYTERNGYRMPSYHRLDLGATWKLRERKHWQSEIAFSLYNAYGRENAYTIQFREAKDNPQRTEAVQTTLFRWIPSISYNFRFK